MLLLVANLSAQECLTGFVHPKAEAFSKSAGQLTIPFFDDFSSASPSPDAELWTDYNVLINDGFAVFPPTRGVATFDALGYTGEVYQSANSTQFVADVLTSRTIRLDSVFGDSPRELTPADSVYFSFFFQPQGTADMPEAGDSLVLEFGVADTTGAMVWHHVWSCSGMSLNDFVADTNFNGEWFRPVSIAVTDSVFFSDSFCFRFYNYASIVSSMYPNSRGNCDNWNIDLVYLDCDRRKDDFTYKKVSYTHQSPSFLKRYTSMPYWQYCYNPTSLTSDVAKAYVTNLDSVGHTVTCTYSVSKTDGTLMWNDANPQTFVLDPYSVSGTDTVDFETGLFVGADADTISFDIDFVVSDTVSGLTDTLRTRQVFHDYYAYDDGMPEMGYGLVSSGGCFAVQFRSFVADTLRGVNLLFNRALNDANASFFNVVVWRDDYGKPGEEICRVENLYVSWSETPYEFVYYAFDNPVALIGNFYVGIEQTSNGIINIGFDTSNDNQKYNFVNYDGVWYNSQYKGSVMLRPVMSGSLQTGLDETQHDFISVYPNPASDFVAIDGAKAVSVTVCDAGGRAIRKFVETNTIPLTHFAEGQYILLIEDTNGAIIPKKIIVSR